METDVNKVEAEIRARRTGSLIWGLFLILFGGVFLLERFGGPNAPSVGELWPLVFYVIATQNFLRGRPGNATMFVLLGTWFLAVNLGWWNLTYGNSWPLVLVAVGAGIVIKALSGEERRRCREGCTS